MSIADFFQRLWKKEAEHMVYAEIPHDHTDLSAPPVTVLAEEHYVRIWLSEAFLADDRRLFRTYLPVVHSSTRLVFGGNPAQELPYVAGPQNVGLGTTLGKGVQLNHPLTNLLPFRGGTVSISAALLAYKERDFLKGFVDVLHDVSGLLNVGQLSTTLKVVDGAIDGIQNLLGAGDKDVHLVYFQAFGGTQASGGNSLKSGYTAVIAAPANRFDKKKLYVKEGQLHVGESLQAAKPLEGFDYMLLRSEVTPTRDDFMAFEEFRKLLTEAIREGATDPQAGLKIIQTAQIAAWTSPDFTKTDRLRIGKAMKEEYEAAVGSEISAGAKALTRRAAPAALPAGAAGTDAGAGAAAGEIDLNEVIKRVGVDKAVGLAGRLRADATVSDFLSAVE